MNIKIKSRKRIYGEITVPGDKSISHRALMFLSLANGRSEIRGLSSSQDVQSTLKCLKNLGVEIYRTSDRIIVTGQGLHGLKEPQIILDAGNSGTTMRLLSGILAGQLFESCITGDSSLKKRPMRRIIEPLGRMGAKIFGKEDQFAPILIGPSQLQGMTHELEIASAQVKSCILLAGLFARGWTTVIEPTKSRDHTEKLLEYMGADVKIKENYVSVHGFSSLKPVQIQIPGDVSSAAFFIVAASIVPDSKLVIKNVGVNPTRTGIIDVLNKMNGNIKIENLRIWNNEEVADIVVSSGQLTSMEINAEIIPRVIDEIPILAIAATQIRGEMLIKGARELRVKESDRIHATVANLKRMGAVVEELPDGMVIRGEQQLKGAEIDSFGDHRIAMAFAVAGLVANGETIIRNAECVNISFPDFFQQLEAISHD